MGGEDDAAFWQHSNGWYQPGEEEQPDSLNLGFRVLRDVGEEEARKSATNQPPQ